MDDIFSRSRIVRWLCVLALSPVILTGVFARSAEPAAAQVQCVSGLGNYFDGLATTARDPSGNTYEGASATLFNNNSGSPICDTGSHDLYAAFSYVWVMIAQNSSAPNLRGYVQIGPYRGWGDCTRFAAEWHKDASDTTLHRDIKFAYGCLGYNTTNQYWTQYVATDNGGQGGVRMNVDTTIMDVSPWNPYAVWGDTTYGPFNAEFSGETTYLGTNVPTTNFGNLQLQMFNDAWTGNLPSLFDVCPWPNNYVKGSVINRSFAIQTSGSDHGLRC